MSAADKIREYLAVGGLFNPEVMNQAQHEAVRDTLMEAREEILSLRDDIERTRNELRLIGDMAVANWDDAVVGEVDAALKGQPVTPTYKAWARSLFARAKRADELEVEVIRLQGQLDGLRVVRSEDLQAAMIRAKRAMKNDNKSAQQTHR